MECGYFTLGPAFAALLQLAFSGSTGILIHPGDEHQQFQRACRHPEWLRGRPWEGKECRIPPLFGAFGKMCGQTEIKT